MLPSHIPTENQIRNYLTKVKPSRRLVNCEVLPGGLINTNIKLSFDDDGPSWVMRLYRDGVAACKKELAIHNLVWNQLPVAAVVHSDCAGFPPTPVTILEYVEGLTFQLLKRTGDTKAIAQASRNVGAVLAMIGEYQFSKPGRLEISGNELQVGREYIEGNDPIPRLVDQFMQSEVFERRAGKELMNRLHHFVWEWAPRLPKLDDSSLVHGDFGNRNLLVHSKEGVWQVSAVLDWEFAFSGSPLLDVGHFLRYERRATPLREPHFSASFVEHGGKLPSNWRAVVRVIDLSAYVEILTHDELPEEVEKEMLELINATLENRDLD